MAKERANALCVRLRDCETAYALVHSTTCRLLVRELWLHNVSASTSLYTHCQSSVPDACRLAAEEAERKAAAGLRTALEQQVEEARAACQQCMSTKA